MGAGFYLYYSIKMAGAYITEYCCVWLDQGSSKSVYHLTLVKGNNNIQMIEFR
jgi:hypothetical protein